MIGRRVEYQTSFGRYGPGTITKFFELTGVFVVEDDKTGALWRGWEDQISFRDKEKADA